MSLFQLFLTVCVTQVTAEILYVLWKARADSMDVNLYGADQDPAAVTGVTRPGQAGAIEATHRPAFASADYWSRSAPGVVTGRATTAFHNGELRVGSSRWGEE
jgi:hypothetical protein